MLMLKAGEKSQILRSKAFFPSDLFLFLITLYISFIENTLRKVIYSCLSTVLRNEGNFKVTLYMFKLLIKLRKVINKEEVKYDEIIVKFYNATDKNLRINNELNLRINECTINYFCSGVCHTRNLLNLFGKSKSLEGDFNGVNLLILKLKELNKLTIEFVLEYFSDYDKLSEINFEIVEVMGSIISKGITINDYYKFIKMLKTFFAMILHENFRKYSICLTVM